MSVGSHAPEAGKVPRIMRQLAEARTRAERARWYGDDIGARIAAAEAARLRRILAEG